MRKLLYSLLIVNCLPPIALAAGGSLFIAPEAFAATGLNGTFYQTIDDETDKPKSIVAVYEYDGKVGGRIVALYGDDGEISETLENPTRIADKVEGAPKMVGLDVIWGMEWDGKEYSKGRIMDPKSGKIYRSVMWQEYAKPDNLFVRGKIGPFGRTQTWNIVSVKDLPNELQKLNLKTWTPKAYD
jgi:uncharacterized protein (DUF2147 family)